MAKRIALLAGVALNLAIMPDMLSAQAPGTPAQRAAAIDRTREVLEAYWKEHDPKYVAEDAVFVMMPTGEKISGRDAIAKHIQGFYHGALDARSSIRCSERMRDSSRRWSSESTPGFSPAFRQRGAT